ncbi:MucBP domain-containing protein [Levilactobacillus brevis]|uniref:MucBP domain-containing protein n=1 Tax=Levilactobacillus brevis TaxID=1580 RepID=UPI000403908B|nr:MucBP domain-containing protein [Levilactobacillus brevis]KIO98887.1 Rab family protein [Levilactobacillus brevis]SQG82120.1 Internalin-J [Levilactobacillus brevis]
MKTSQQHGIKQHKNRWLMTSAVALTLGTVGLTTEVAQADTTSDTPDVTGQTEAANQSTTNQVKLTTSQPTAGSATEQTVPAKAADNQKNATTNTSTESATAASPATKSTEPAAAPKTATTIPATESETVKSQAGADTTATYDESDAAGVANAKADKTPTQNGLRAARVAVPQATPQTVDDLIPDKNLQQLVLYAIQQTHPEITATNQITADLLSQLTRLDVDSAAGDTKQETDRAFYDAIVNVESLTGLEKATNLQRLVITPEARASRLWGNTSLRGQLKDLTALQALTQLTTLNLGYNQITDEDAKALANLTNLTSLSLMDNNITDLTFLTNLTALTSLNVSQDADNPNKITNLKPLAKLVNLSTIVLDNNNISDLSPLRNITAIPQLMSLGGNHIFDIMPVLSLNWQPFFDPEQPFYNIGADGQTWTLDQVALNPATQHLSTWSFAYDNLHDFNEFMDSDPQSPATAKGIGVGNWTVWSDLSQPEGTLKLVWDVSRHNDYRQPVAPDGLRFSGTIMVPYTLQAGTGAVTVDFQLDGGVEIAPFVILSGQTGSGLDVLTDASVQQTIAELEDRGFTYEKPVKLSPDLSQTTADSTVTYNSDAQNITLLFSPLQKIYLVDEAGNAIGQKLVKESGRTGSTWQTTIPAIDGYQYDRVAGPVTVADQQLNGTIGDVNPDIYVYYKASEKPVTPVDPGNPGTPITTGTVTVHYQTATGDSIDKTDTLSGPVGQAYTTTAKTIPGYQLITTSGNADGIYSATSQDVYYIYQLQDTQTAGSGDQGKPVTGGDSGKITPNQPAPKPSAVTRQPTKLAAGQGDQIVRSSATTATAKLATKTVNLTATARPVAKVTAETLPQTNEQRTTAWWGVALLAVLGGIFGLKRGKREH